MEKQERPGPPKWPLKILSCLLRADYLEEIEGDMRERFEDNLDRYGRSKARSIYFLDSLKLLSPALLKDWGGDHSLNNLGMFRLYLKAATRTLVKNKVYSLINLLGLTVGMGVCLVIFQYVYFELSYDQFHRDHDQIYRVVVEETNSSSRESYPDGIGYALGPTALAELPEVIHYIRKGRVNRTAAVTNLEDKSVYYEEANRLLYADPSFFEIFNFPLTQGQKANIFEDRYSIVITQSTANKYFGDKDPIGKVLQISGPPTPGEYYVTGVVEDPPVNSHWQFGFLLPMNTYIEYGWGGAVKKNDDWNGFKVITYFKLDESADPQQVKQKLDQLVARNSQQEDVRKEVTLQPVSDIYLGSEALTYPGHFNSTGSMQNIVIFSVISVFILLIAWVNYINLAIAQSLQRSKEVGVRKALGAHRGQLISQFVMESTLINLLAAALALGLATLLLPLVSQFVGKTIEMNLIYLPEFWGVLLCIVVLGALLSGLYPAFILSGFRPINALKDQHSAPGKSRLRKGLMVFQFLTSLLLITATYIVFKQVSFLKNQELSMDLEKILILEGPRVVSDREKAVESFRVFREELARHASIEAVSGSLFAPGNFWTGGYRLPGQPISEAPYSQGFYTTLNFENTYQLEFLAGGPFSSQMQDEKVVIINEEVVKALGFDSPEEAINQKLVNVNRSENIVGVVKNFHWHSLRDRHRPYIISLYENRLTETISIRLNTQDITNTLAHIKTTFDELFPGNPFDYHFADAAFDSQYDAERQFGKLFFFFSVLAIFIGCVGLFALVAYSANLKVKEIGIRKVLGAKVTHIVLLLSREYFYLILLTIVIATPAVWLVGGQWLESYAHRIALSPDLFLLPAFGLTLIAILTIAHRTISTAHTNPVDSLKNE